MVAARRLDGGETRGVSVPAAPASGALDVFDPPSLRLPALDGIRGLAILMIMQYHFWGLGFGLVERAPRLGLDRWVASIRELGWTSVDLFFVLSGFLITGLLLDAKARSGHYFRNFYARRSLRIFPLYYLFLAFVLTVAGHIPFLAAYATIPELRAHQLWFWTYGVNVAACVPAIGAQIPVVYTHFWTLAVEEQFYLVWPLVVFTLDVRRLRATCIGMVAVALGLRIAVVAGLFGRPCSPTPLTCSRPLAWTRSRWARSSRSRHAAKVSSGAPPGSPRTWHGGVPGCSACSSRGAAACRCSTRGRSRSGSRSWACCGPPCSCWCSHGRPRR